ncbi:MAG: transporter substrate-binding domain-containing protein, partial [Candidatus Thiodiazotropha sp.]
LIFSLGLISIISIGTVEGETIDGDAKTLYKVAIDQEYAPYEFVDLDGQIKGFTPDLLFEIGKLSGINFHFMPMDWPEAVAALEDGRIDLINMIRTEQRLNQHEFSEPHSRIKQAVFRHISASGISSLESLSGYRVALQRNDISLEMLAQRADFKRLLVQSKAEGFLLLNAGKADAFLAADQAGLRIIQKFNLSDVKLAAVGLFPQDYSFAARKGNHKLINLLNTNLVRLKESGRYQVISEKWFTPDISEPSWFVRHQRMLLGFVGTISITLVVFVVWNVMLRRTIDLRTKALRESRDSLNEAQRIARIGNWEWDITVDSLQWSAETFRIFGIDPEKFGANFETFIVAIHPDDQARVRDFIRQSIAAGLEEWAVDYHVGLPTGELRFIHEEARSVFAEDGRLIKIFATVQDITEQKRGEEALLRLNRELRAISNCNHILMLATDEQELLGEICRIICDDAGYRMAWVGHPENDAAKSIRPVAWAGVDDGYLEQAGITWADTARGRGPSGTAIRLGKSISIQDFSTDPTGAPWRNAALQRGYRSSISLPLKDESANTIGILNIYSSVPYAFTPEEIRLLEELAEDMAFGIKFVRTRIERKRAEEELRQINERYFLSTRAAGLGVWDWDLQKNELIWDDRMYELYGTRREDFTGAYEAWLKGIHPDDRVASDEISKQAQRSECEYDTEFRVVWPDGSIHHLKAYAQFVRDAEGKPLRMTGVNYDITEHKRAELEVKTLNHELERRVAARTADLQAANKELEAFSYSVSHDLRVPLRAIDGFSHILLEDYTDKLDKEGKRLLNVIRDNTSRMGQLIDDILQFSRAGRLEINFSSIDMEKLARAAFTELRSSFAESNLQLEIEPLPPANGDAAMIRQVFVNLLSNAIKFSRTQEAPRIQVGSLADSDETVYYVKDNGVGFDMQFSDKLFGVFQRLHGVNEFEGTGIGLAIVKRIITRHGGRVWAEGEINHGAAVYFTLPDHRISD